MGLLLLSGVASSGTSAVGLAGVMDTKQGVFNESTLVPFGLFMAGLTMTAMVVWKVAGHKAQTDLKLNDLIHRIERMEEAINNKDEST